MSRGGHALRSDRGSTLVVALGIMLVISLLVVGTIQFTAANARTASRDNADQQAYSLATAGVNEALATLARHYYPLNPAATWPGDPNALPPATSSHGGGSVTWSGTLDQVRAIWTLTATSTVANPTGPDAAPVRRTATAKVRVIPPPPAPTGNAVWNWVYSGATGSTCDMSIGQSVQISSPLYVAGNLCLLQTASVVQPPGLTAANCSADSSSSNQCKRLVVGGQITLTNPQNAVGSSSAPLTEANIVNGCKWRSNPLYNPCVTHTPTTQTNVFVAADGFYTTPFSLPIPVPDWNHWYWRASPGPFQPCQTREGTPPTFDLATDVSPPPSPLWANLNNNAGVFTLNPPGQSYRCVTAGGELSWDAAARVLTVQNDVYIDGSIVLAQQPGSAPVRYAGKGVLYLSGYLKTQNNSKLCARLAGSDCDFANWDPADAVLVVVAKGLDPTTGIGIAFNQSQFQGGLYATSPITADQQSWVQGPMISPAAVTPGQGGNLSFPPIPFMPSGSPGEAPPPPTLGPAEQFTG